MKRIAWIILGYLASMIPAQAASFDCGKISSSLEKTICTDPEISLLDETLANGYGNAMKVLSVDGKRILRENQRGWLHFVNDVCFKYKNNRGTDVCVKKMYNNRIKDMETAAILIGPFMFSRIDYYFSKSDDKFGSPFQGQTSYPRIDSPLSENLKKWNALMAPKTEAEEEEGCDWGKGFAIKSATENFISSQVGNWMYCHGTPHGYGAVHDKTYILLPEPHLLTASDLFSLHSPWEDFLIEKCSDAVESKAKEEGVEEVNRDQVEQQIKQVVLSPDAWSLTKESLVVTINPGIVFGNAFGTTEVTIPWKELSPFLVSNTPLAQQSPLPIQELITDTDYTCVNGLQSKGVDHADAMKRCTFEQ